MKVETAIPAAVFKVETAIKNQSAKSLANWLSASLVRPRRLELPRLAALPPQANDYIADTTAVSTFITIFANSFLRSSAGQLKPKRFEFCIFFD